MIAPHHAPATVFGQVFLTTLGRMIRTQHAGLDNAEHLPRLAGAVASECANATRIADLGMPRESHVRDCVRMGCMARLMRADLLPATVVRMLDPEDFA